MSIKMNMAKYPVKTTAQMIQIRDLKRLTGAPALQTIWTYSVGRQGERGQWPVDQERPMIAKPGLKEWTLTLSARNT